MPSEVSFDGHCWSAVVSPDFLAQVQLDEAELVDVSNAYAEGVCRDDAVLDDPSVFFLVGSMNELEIIERDGAWYIDPGRSLVENWLSQVRNIDSLGEVSSAWTGEHTTCSGTSEMDEPVCETIAAEDGPDDDYQANGLFGLLMMAIPNPPGSEIAVVALETPLYLPEVVPEDYATQGVPGDYGVEDVAEGEDIVQSVPTTTRESPATTAAPTGG